MNTRRSTRNKAEEMKTQAITKQAKSKQTINKVTYDDESSSDSSVGDYLKNPDEIDLNSSFFNINTAESPANFEAIEKKIFSDVKNLSDSSDSDEADDSVFTNIVEESVIKDVQNNENRKINFSQLHEYNKKIEEAKACVQNYKSKISHEEKMDISSLLSVGESKSCELENTMQTSEYNDADSDDEMEWEEIEDKDTKPVENVKIPKEGVQITVALPNVVRKKKGIDFVAAIKRRINRIKKENQVYVHKVHLLCWIAHGNFVNSVLNNENLLALTLSLLPSEQCYPPKHADINYLERIVKWYGKLMKLNEKVESENVTPLEQSIQEQIYKKEAWSKRVFVFIFLMILRSIGLQCRLVLSLQCLPLRPSSEDLCSLSEKKKTNATVNREKKEVTKQSGQKLGTATPGTSKTSKSQSKKTLVDKNKITKEITCKEKTIKRNVNKSDSTSGKLHLNKNEILKEKKSTTKEETEKKHTSSKLKVKCSTGTSKSTVTHKENSAKETKRTNEKERTLRSSARVASVKSDNKRNIKISQLDGADDSDISSKSPKDRKKPNLGKLKKKSTTHSSSDSKTERNKHTESESVFDDFKTDMNENSTKKSLKTISKNKGKPTVTSKNKIGPSKQLNVQKDIINIIKDHMLEKKHTERTRKIKKARKSDSDDSDYIPEPPEKKRRSIGRSDSENEFKINTKVKRRVKPRSEIIKILSTDDESDQGIKQKKKGHDVWVEVFLESEEKWISADVIKGQVHCISELYSRASQPVSYILAWNNNLSIKDVTARYCPRWNTVTRKLRIDSKWWNETLKPFMGVKTGRDREEDEDLARQQLDKPLPTTINEYKDHPLYVLKRHLLKFQAIYPPDALTLGFVRNEPVYARECVYTLHSREIWVKHAKVVKLGQTPYKIVKARPKYDKLSGAVITDKPLELFGVWQVQDYVPPVAENGVVPRNSFGNVELFKSCMLPKGTVHLQLPGLNKVARKLQIDCASAVVGFDFHGGWSHPTFDGFVVCEEFKETLIAAWEEDQEQTARKEQEKFEKRVYDNWRKLIKGLLIRERLKARYDFASTSGSGGGKSKKSKGTKLNAKKRRICSDNESE